MVHSRFFLLVLVRLRLRNVALQLNHDSNCSFTGLMHIMVVGGAKGPVVHMFNIPFRNLCRMKSSSSNIDQEQTSGILR